MIKLGNKKKKKKKKVGIVILFPHFYSLLKRKGRIGVKRPNDTIKNGIK